MMPAPARLSAAALSTWAACPRRYALAYRAKRYWPAADGPAPGVAAALDALSAGVDPEALGEDEEGVEAPDAPSELILSEALRQAQAQRERMQEGAEVGSVLHTRIWAQAQGMDPLAFGQQLGEGARLKLESRWQAYLGSEEAWAGGAPMWHELKLEGAWEGLRLEVRFDRLALRDGLWWIVDFKGGKAPKGDRLRQLQRSWQAKLYPFALHRLSSALGLAEPIPPEGIRLRFLYLGDPSGAKAIDFAPDAPALAATEAELKALLPKLNAPLNPESPLVRWPFQDALKGAPTPQRWPADHVCLSCPYFSLCHPLAPPDSSPPAAWGRAHFVWSLDGSSPKGDAGPTGGP